ncbi:PhzF family phenazine biosynthesis protein [Kitasatospora paranensis]|uniref:PhzF family phenazine biosynthesis isomerase n=1 Tax=Kitasatospora paranensis TaxID=258053 RepID=A0ABW2FXP0_9ACTN
MRIRIIDAFTDRPFGGNPAAVCVLDETDRPGGADRPGWTHQPDGPDRPDGTWPEDAWMRRVAAEMNQSETAFALRRAAPDGTDWGLRWFTPVNEAHLCGHATLATAHALHSDGLIGRDWVRFGTRSGVLRARPEADGSITLDLPASRSVPAEPLPGLESALGCTPLAVLRTAALDKALVLLSDERTVRALTPDLAAVARLPIRSVTVTAPAEDRAAGYDFVSRNFCPAVGIPEDPVTGGAHTALAPYWAARLGRSEVTGYQASSRGGLMACLVTGERVMLRGRAVTVVDGTLRSEPTGPRQPLRRAAVGRAATRSPVHRHGGILWRRKPGGGETAAVNTLAPALKPSDAPRPDPRAHGLAADFAGMDDLVADLVLPAHAPSYVVSALETSRELVRHAFYRYEFGTVAVTHALVAVEHALGERCGVGPTFPDLITQAAAAGLVPPGAADLLQACRLLRDQVARGTVTSAALTLPRAVEMVRAAFDTAALLFPAPAAAGTTTEDGGGTPSDNRLARLWAEHRGTPFPASFRGVDIENVDLILLDADVAGLVQRELTRGLDDEGIAILWACIANLDRILPLIGTEDCRSFYAQLRTLAGLAAARHTPAAS